MKKNVYVLGNPVEKSDSLPVKILPRLKKIFPDLNFIYHDPTEEINISDKKELIIIDTVKCLKRVTVFHDINDFLISPRVTVHDYDLPLNLGILKKLGKVKKITIIGIPKKGKEKQILERICFILKNQCTHFSKARCNAV